MSHLPIGGGWLNSTPSPNRDGLQKFSGGIFFESVSIFEVINLIIHWINYSERDSRSSWVM